jgi:hypothetical protein
MGTAVFAGAIGVLGAASLFADFSYEQSSKITGGAMASMMRVAGAFSREAREPVRSTIMVKGNRMVTLGKNQATVIDLDRETITDINFDKKTYSSITFQQMAQALEAMARKLKQQPGAPDMKFKVDVKETGQTRQIQGLNTSQKILSFEIEGTDAKSGQKGSIVVQADMWLAAAMPGYGEVQNFYTRMAQKVNWNPGGGMGMMGMSQPGIGKGLQGLQKEAAKLDGVPVLQITRMIPKGEGTEAAMADQGGQSQQVESAPPPEPRPSAGEVAGQAAGQTAGTEINRRSGGRFGGLSAGLGGLGGRFGRGRKQEQQQQQEQSEQPAQQQTPQAPAQPGVLMELTTELASFSSAPVDGSRFEVPAGFKHVEHDMLKQTR